MLDDSMIRFLQGGCSIVVGTVGDDGSPHAARAWGLTVVDPAGDVVRLLADADDEVTRANLAANGKVAMTCTDVPTLRSYQFKGRVLLLEEATTHDEGKRQQYARDFLLDIHHTDRNPLDMLERWARPHVTACVIRIDESFNQTPGPSAGCAVAAGDLREVSGA